jgi:radical SAM superfamily enzyme YgiQ (UPF0313 family)
MKLKLIYPEWGSYPLLYRRYIPTLGLITVASLTPPDIRVSITDERIESIDFSEDVDLVGISVMTCQARRSYEIASTYREKGVTVVLGGIHPSLLPEEASQYSDAVVIGEAEGSWLNLIEDFREKRLQRYYSCPGKEIKTPLPKWGFYSDKGYLPISPIQLSRGCPLDCEFCSVPSAFGNTFKMHPEEDILKMINGAEEYLFFINDNIHIARRRTQEIFNFLSSQKKKWVGLVPLNIAEDKRYLSSLVKSGCWALYVDFSPWLSASLNKKVGDSQVVKDIENIKRIKDTGIKIIASFIFGFDHDDKGSFERTVNFARITGIEEAEFHILTPYPKTRLWDKLFSEGRIIEKDFSLYNTTHVVYRPKLMTPEELLDGFLYAWREFYPADSYIDTPDGPVIKTLSAFPLEKEDLLSRSIHKGYNPRWMEAVFKEGVHEGT